MKTRTLLLAPLLCALLSACTAPQTLLLRTTPVTAAAPVQIPDVPFFPQEEHQCGPAALATMLNFAGKSVTPAALTEKVYVPERKGSFALEMVAAARSEGRLVYPVAPQMEAVLTALDQGYPVLVLQNNGLGIYPVWHFAVVVGADRTQEKLWLRSGRTERLEMSFSTFERTWARADYWAVLVFDPTRIPDNLDPKPVIRELALMEKAGVVSDAQAGFSRALLNWPAQKTAWLGLAQTSATLGDVETAESALRELVRREPAYGPGLNNLADFLFQRGRAREALHFAERAVAVMDVPQTRSTLAAIHTELATRDKVQIPLRRPSMDMGTGAAAPAMILAPSPAP
ncbi:MAG: PA2778 family cysteine peptidase [Moraxellaceae bacterium]